MDYRIFDLESRAPLDTLELHVLARAYYAAWRAVHGTTPESRHPMPMFNVLFDFDDSSTMPLQSGVSATLPDKAVRLSRTSTLGHVMDEIRWTNPNGIDLRSSFVYFIRVRDSEGGELRYVGKARGESRLKEYVRNIKKIFAERTRGTTQKYRAIHFVLAKACELGWFYEFFPIEAVDEHSLNAREQFHIQNLDCNLNGARTWSIDDYTTLSIQSLVCR